MGFLSWLTGKISLKDFEKKVKEDRRKEIESFDKAIESEQKQIKKQIKEVSEVNKIKLNVVGLVKEKHNYSTIYISNGYNLDLVIPDRSILLKGIKLEKGDVVEITIKKVGK